MKQRRAKVFLGVLVCFTTSMVIFFGGELLAKHQFQIWYGFGATDDGAAEKIDTKILFLGDSFCVAPYSFPNLIKRAQGSRFRVVTVAESGWGPDHYLMGLNRSLVFFHPDVCVVSLYLGNDVLNLYDMTNNSAFERVKLFLGSRFFLYHLFRRAWIRIRYAQHEEAVPARTDANASEAHNPWLVHAAARNPDAMQENLYMKGDHHKNAFMHLKRLLSEMKLVASRAGCEIIFVGIPDAVQLDRCYHSFYREIGFHIPVGIEHVDLLQRSVEEHVNEMGALFVDLLSTLKRKQPCSNYFHNDNHLTPMGHRVVARSELFDILNRMIDKEKPNK